MVLICPSTGGRGAVEHQGGDEVSLRHDEIPPAGGCGCTGDSAHIPEHCLNLFPGAACNLWLESPIAAWSHWPAQRRAIREGWLGMISRSWNLQPSSDIGPGGRRL